MAILDYLRIDYLLLILFALQSAAFIRLRKRTGQRDNLVANLQKEVEALLLCERGMADRMKQQQSQMRGIASRQDKQEITEHTQVNYKQAIALMKKGATTDEMVEACDISRGEVDLISHMQKLKKARAQQRAA